MYKRHRILSVFLLVAIFALGVVLKLQYSHFAEVAITVIAIEFAVFVSVPAVLMGSPYSKTLKKLPDKENPTKSMLGVLAAYLKIAGICSVLTIIISTIYLIKANTSFFRFKYENDCQVVLQLVSSASFAMFFYNIFLMCLIMKFLLSALLSAASQN